MVERQSYTSDIMSESITDMKERFELYRKPGMCDSEMKTLFDMMEKLITPEDYDYEFSRSFKQMELLINTMNKLFSQINKPAPNFCSIQSQSDTHVTHLKELIAVYEMLLTNLQTQHGIILDSLELTNCTMDDKALLNSVKDNVERYTEQGKFKQMLKDKAYIYKYNSHYGYTLGFGILSMVIFTIYSNYNR